MTPMSGQDKRPATPPLGVPAMPAPARTSTAALPGATRMPAAARPDLETVLPNATAAERAAVAETNALSFDERVRFLGLMRLVDQRDPWALLGVPQGSDAKVLKRTYFKLSKDIHPDRYYGKQLGSFAERLSTIFEAVSRAYARLTSPEKQRPKHEAVSEQPQTPQEYAAELFERACGLEVGGEALDAMKLFAAAVRIDPQTRYLRRAASCALAAGQPKTALEYAKKAQSQAPNDPSLARLLASAFKATERYADAEEVLVMAMAIKSENDVLTAELRNDLAEVRRLMST
jgi:tetratricopeptide (TPR) repeat protein